MRTITLCAYRRPDYLSQVLDSLQVARVFAPEYEISRVVIGIDGGGEESVREIAERNAERSPFKTEVISWPRHLGVSEHPRRLLQYAYTELNSEFNLHLEDDTVLSPDALRLCAWYEQQITSGERSFHLLCLHSLSRSYDRADCVRLRHDFGAWGWAADHMQWWNWLAPYWNHRREEPLGFDWSLTDTIQQRGLKVVSPVLSRVRNIGREGGEHQTPEGYDRDMEGLVWARDQEIQAIDQFRLVNL